MFLGGSTPFAPIRQFQFLILLASLACAELAVPWQGVFDDTLLSCLEPEARSSTLYSRTKIYRHLEENRTSFGRTFNLRPGFWVQPRLETSFEHIGQPEERLKDIKASMLLGRDLSRALTGLVLVQPQHGVVTQGVAGDTFYARTAVDNGDVGAGFRVRPFERTTIYAMAVGTYWSRLDSLLSRDRGWGSEWAAKSTFDPVLLDSVSFIGEVRNQEREMLRTLVSNVRVLAFASLDSLRTVAVMLRHGSGRNRDDFKHRNEENLSMSASVLAGYSPGQTVFRLYIDRAYEEEAPSRSILVDAVRAAASAEIRGSDARCAVLAGVGRAAEENLFEYSLNHDERHFWLDGEVQWQPGMGLLLEWRGHGKIVAADYPRTTLLGDSLRDRLDNDNVSVDHWLGLSRSFASACTLFVQGRYSEETSQNLVASRSGYNRIDEVYSLSPTITWGLGSFFHHRQVFEIIAAYVRSPFAASSNTLSRQLRSTSQVTCFLDPVNQTIFTYGFLKSDLGLLDSLDYYMVRSKQQKHDWLLEWNRTLWGGLQWRPGFGMVINRRTSFDNSTRSYVNFPALASRIYSLRAIRPEGLLTLSARAQFIQERADRGYWDASVTAQGGF